MSNNLSTNSFTDFLKSFCYQSYTTKDKIGKIILIMKFLTIRFL